MILIKNFLLKLLLSTRIRFFYVMFYDAYNLFYFPSCVISLSIDFDSFRFNVCGKKIEINMELKHSYIFFKVTKNCPLPQLNYFMSILAKTTLMLQFMIYSYIKIFGLSKVFLKKDSKHISCAQDKNLKVYSYFSNRPNIKEKTKFYFKIKTHIFKSLPLVAIGSLVQ